MIFITLSDIIDFVIIGAIVILFIAMWLTDKFAKDNRGG